MKTQTHKGIGGIWGERTGYMQAQDEYLGWLLRPRCIPQGCVSGSNALYWDEWAIRQTAWTHIPVPMTRCRSRDAVVWSVSHVWLFVTLWTAACQASLTIINSWNLFKLMTIESVMPSNILILCCPLLLPPSIFPSIRSFQMSQFFASGGQSIWVSVLASSWYSGLISFRMDWFDQIAVQRTLKSLLQHHISKASILWCSAFFLVQLSHP